jgi:hypothetical protein
MIMKKRMSSPIQFFLYDNRVKSFHEVRDGFLYGRMEGDRVYPRDGLVSRRHCRFSIAGNEIYIEDIGSSNPTRVNSVPIRPGKKRRIRFNDVIEIGNQRLILTHQNLHPPGNTEDSPKKVPGIVALQKADGSITRFFRSELTRTLANKTLLLLDRTTFKRLRRAPRKRPAAISVSPLKLALAVALLIAAPFIGRTFGLLAWDWGTFGKYLQITRVIQPAPTRPGVPKSKQVSGEPQASFGLSAR